MNGLVLDTSITNIGRGRQNKLHKSSLSLRPRAEDADRGSAGTAGADDAFETTSMANHLALKCRRRASNSPAAAGALRWTPQAAAAASNGAALQRGRGAARRRLRGAGAEVAPAPESPGLAWPRLATKAGRRFQRGVGLPPGLRLRLGTDGAGAGAGRERAPAPGYERRRRRALTRCRAGAGAGAGRRAPGRSRAEQPLCCGPGRCGPAPCAGGRARRP